MFHSVAGSIHVIWFAGFRDFDFDFLILSAMGVKYIRSARCESVWFASLACGAFGDLLQELPATEAFYICQLIKNRQGRMLLVFRA